LVIAFTALQIFRMVNIYAGMYSKILDEL